MARRIKPENRRGRSRAGNHRSERSRHPCRQREPHGISAGRPRATPRICRGGGAMYRKSSGLRKLHSYGLLRNSFCPPEEIRVLRSLWRLRDRHVKDAAEEIQHRVRASVEELARRLEGTWREDVLFRVAAGGGAVRLLLAANQGMRSAIGTSAGGALPAPRKNQPVGFDLQAELKRICRVDLTRIDGVKVMTRGIWFPG
jgi:hypothetical protein